MKVMFKKGDKVKIIGGYFKGEIGEVIIVHEELDKLEGNTAFVVKFDDFTIRHYLGKDLELVSTEQTPSNIVKAKTFLNSLYGDTDSLNDIFKPNHYQGKNGDLFDEWYERYPFEVFRIVLLSTAERYFRRYHLKDGLDGLQKGIEVMKRLQEYELKENEND